MFGLFKCKHGADKLAVQREATQKKLDDDFDEVFYHLYCTGCGEEIFIRYARMNDGVEGYMGRTRKRLTQPPNL